VASALRCSIIALDSNALHIPSVHFLSSYMPVSSLLCLQSDPQLDAECLGASWNFDWSTVPLSNRAENAMNANLFVVDSMWLSCTVRRDFWPSWHFALLLSQGWKPHEKFAKQVLERRMGSVGWLDRMEMLRMEVISRDQWPYHSPFYSSIQLLVYSP
jgi:hypothetical protein